MSMCPYRCERQRLIVIRAFAVLLALASVAAGAAPPRRIVSLDLCADQYLIALADPGQIASLSRYARDPEMSYSAVRAADLPAAAQSAEQVLMLRPDLVIGAPWSTREALAPLAARGVAMVDMPQVESFAAIGQMVIRIAGAVGHPERGTALIAAMRARIAGIGPPSGRGRVAAYYQRRGYLTGGGTLVDEMMQRLGLVNLATRLGRPALSRLSLEEMAVARPDLLILESATAQVADQGTEMLHHPALAGIPRLYIPQALTVCAGPSYPDAVALLAARLRAADAHQKRRRTPPVAVRPGVAKL